MKKRKLRPEHVLATSKLSPEDMLPFKIYYRVFEQGHGTCLPPIVIAKIRDHEYWIEAIESTYRGWVTTDRDVVKQRRRDYRVLFDRLAEIPYFILDGNHRALAATLTNHSIQALEIDSDQDIQRIQDMLVKGDLFFFPHKVTSVRELEGLFLQHSLSLTAMPPHHSLVTNSGYLLRRMRSVRLRADLLCYNDLLPAYIQDQYKQGRPNIEAHDVVGNEEYNFILR